MRLLHAERDLRRHRRERGSVFDAERRGRMLQRQHCEPGTVLRQLIHDLPVRRTALVVRPRAIVRMRDVALPELRLPGCEPERQHPELRLRVSVTHGASSSPDWGERR